jgi:RimJ/RimL family protein N-acetyltransferase
MTVTTAFSGHDRPENEFAAGAVILRSYARPVADRTIVTTGRLTLAPAAVVDAEALWPIFSDPDGWWFDPDGRHTDPEQSRIWLTKAAAAWERDGLSYWTARLTVSGEPIGVGGMQRRPSRSWNLFYRLATSAWGSGYATELGRAGLAAAEAHDADVPVEAWIAAHNEPSIRVAKRLGLHDYGAHTDVWDGSTKRVFADRPPAVS